MDQLRPYRAYYCSAIARTSEVLITWLHLHQLCNHFPELAGFCRAWSDVWTWRTSVWRSSTPLWPAACFNLISSANSIIWKRYQLTFFSSILVVKRIVELHFLTSCCSNLKKFPFKHIIQLFNYCKLEVSGLSIYFPLSL